MKINDLQDGQQVTVRTSRRDNIDGDAPEWSEWRQATLFIQRDKKTQNVIAVGFRSFEWAEYDVRYHYDAKYNEFLAEEYRAQIKELEGKIK